MPANLTPDYLEAEAQFKQAKTVPDKIKTLEVMMAVIPKHKGTERLRGQLKSRMAKLKEELQKRPSISRAEQIYNVKREGAGQVVLVGPPNTGKSTLLSHITHALSEVGEYPFTTQRPVPGMMAFENIQIQLIDSPPVQLDHGEPGFSNLLRNADVLVMVLDLTDDPVFQMEILLEELGRMKINLVGRAEHPPGGEGYVFLKTLLAGNKCDLPKAMEGYRDLEGRFGETLPVLPISAKEEMNFDALKEEIYRLLGVIRVYTKVPGKESDRTEPVILRRGSTIEDVALSVHKDFAAKLRYARIWGSGRFDGQMVKRDHPVNEGDVVEFHL